MSATRPSSPTPPCSTSSRRPRPPRFVALGWPMRVLILIAVLAAAPARALDLPPRAEDLLDRGRVTYEARAAAPFTVPGWIARATLRHDVSAALLALRREASGTSP